MTEPKKPKKKSGGILDVWHKEGEPLVIPWNDLEENIYFNIVEALKKHDENVLREEIMRLMKAFLRGEARLPFMEMIASSYLMADVYWEEAKGFEIKDKALENVYSSLTYLVDRFKYEDDYKDDPDAPKKFIIQLINSLEKMTHLKQHKLV